MREKPKLDLGLTAFDELFKDDKELREEPLPKAITNKRIRKLLIGSKPLPRNPHWPQKKFLGTR